MSDDVEYAIITKLLAYTPLTTLVSTRIYRNTLPSNPTYPAIIVSEISDSTPVDHSTGGWVSTRIQCTILSTGTGGGEAGKISRIVRDALHRTVNTLLTAGTGKVFIQKITDGGSRPDANTDLIPVLYMRHRDVIVLYDYRL
jgi:hypothetical protein